MRWIDRVARAIPKHILLHFVAGVLTGALSCVVAPGIHSMKAVVVVAVGKEVYDRQTTGCFSFLDIAATLAGGLVPYVVQWVL